MKIGNPFTLWIFSDWDSKFDTFFCSLWEFILNFLLHYHKPENSEKGLNNDVCDCSKILGYLKIRAAWAEINKCLQGPIISF